MSDHLLSLAIWVPIVFGLVVLATGSDRNAPLARMLSLFGALAGLLVTIPLYTSFDISTPAMQFVELSPWISHFNINYNLGVDGISMLFILLNSFITVIVVLAGWKVITSKIGQYNAAFLIMSGLMTIVLALIIVLATFVLTYQLSKNKFVALFSAFFFIMSPELTIFTMRALPELLGLLMIPLTIYFMMKKEWIFAILGSIVTALTHQMTLAVLVGVIGMYAVLQLAWAGWLYYRSRKDPQVAFMDKLKYSIMCLVTAFVPCATYGLWQVYSLGTLSIFGIAQVVNKEGNVVDLPLFLRSGVFVLIFFVIGLASILYNWWTARAEKKKSVETPAYGFSLDTNAVLLIISWLVVTIVLMKNDLLGIHIFMDRFFTFFVMMAVIVAGYGMYAVLSAIDLDILKEKQE